MMQATLRERGLTFKAVTVVGASTSTDEQVLVAALAAAGETRESIFGWTLARLRDGQCAVDLFTD